MAQAWTLTPEFEWVEEATWKTQQTPFLLGYVQTRAYWPRPKRIFRLRWEAALDVDIWYARSFFRDLKGPAGSFDYTPVDPIATPHRAGDGVDGPNQISASYPGRTYYFAISWQTALGETTLSPESSFVISAGKRAQITVPVFWYRTITGARVYVGTVSGSLTLQATVTSSNGIWTEPDTGGANGLISGASPPSTNTAKETVTVHLMDDMMPIPKTTPVSYSMDLSFEELF